MWQPAEGGETISAAEAGYASPDLGAAVGEKAEGEVKPPMDPTSLGDKPSPPAPPAPPSAPPAPVAESAPAEGVEEPTAPSPQPDADGAPLATRKIEEKEGTVS